MGAIRPIVPILINAGGTTVPVYALIDSGANKSAILSSLVYKIGAEIHEKSCKVSTFGQVKETTCEFTSFFVQPLDKKFSKPVKNAVVGDVLTGENEKPLTNSDIANHAYLKDVNLQELKDKTIGVILDASFVRNLAGSEIREDTEEDPMAVRTSFGWTVMGPPFKEKTFNRSNYEDLALNAQEITLLEEIMGPSKVEEKFDISACNVQEMTLLQEINTMFRHDFIMGRDEVFPHEQLHPSKEDEFSEKQLIESISFDQELEAYVCGLPYAHGREDSADILNSVDSYSNAERRLFSLRKKLR